MNFDFRVPVQGLVSILIVTRDRSALLDKCLSSCFSQQYPALEVIVLDNASTDKTQEMSTRKYPMVKFISMHSNLGFFPVLNVAVANSKGEFIMTVDDDAYFMHDSAIGDLVECFRQDRTLGAATCNLEGPNERPITRGDRFISVFTTGFTMVQRDVFSKSIGYYPDLFFRSAGESYVCSTLWDQGKTVKRFQDIRMYHELSMVGRSNGDWQFYGLRSQLLCSVMRDPAILVLPSLLSKAGKSFLQFVRRGYLLTWFAVWFSFLLNLNVALAYRRPIAMSTWRKLNKLSKNYITDLSQLKG